MEQNATHEVTVGNEKALVNSDNFRSVVDEMVARNGGVQPVVRDLRAVPAAAPAPQSIFPQGKRNDLPTLVIAGQKYTPVDGGVSAVGKARSNEDRLALQIAGFAPKQPIYDVGTRVNSTGVSNASKSRLEFENLPVATEACHQLMHRVAQEQRKDVEVERAFTLRLTPDGILTRGGQTLPVTENAFGSLLSRTAIGGHAYLRRCPPELRATNVNFWQDLNEAQENEAAVKATARREKFEPVDAKLRTRINGAGREVFAVTSASYGTFDVDKIARAIALACPKDARGSVVYDGERAQFEVLFHSNVQPKDYVAGEFFKAGVKVRTYDTGGGSIRVSAVVWQNLCLNLIILDECVQKIDAIKHVGSVEKLAARFRVAFKAALGAIDHFIGKWDSAVEEDALSGAVDASGVVLPETIRIEDVLPGLFNGIVERELVPVRGDRKQVVRDLMTMYAADDSAARVGKSYVSRAAVVNAFTRYAHAVNDNPFHQNDIETAAGALLVRSGVLPYESIDLSDG